MRNTRIFVDQGLSINENISLNETSSNHIANVLRMKVNEMLILFNGDSFEYEAIIVAIHRRSIEVAITKKTQKITRSPLHLHLGQGVSRGEKMDWLVQKATETGVQAITPVITLHCGVQLSTERWEKKQQHWQAIADSACEQSGRTDRLLVHAPELLTTWLEKSFEGIRLMLEPEASSSLRTLKNPTAIQMLIGPEGGFHQDEIAHAIRSGFETISLGPRIFRTETAGLVVSSIAQCLWGDII
jgi:16S rRNA (uracil1498-N3)-methyltransferase